MRVCACFALICAFAPWGFTEDPSTKPSSLTVPSRFEDGFVQLKWTSPLAITNQRHIHGSLYNVFPSEAPKRWNLSFDDWNVQQPLRPNPYRAREWWPLGRLVKLNLHREADGTVTGESMVPVGHDWIIDDRTGSFKWTGPERQLRISMWFKSEADVEPTLTTLELLWSKAPEK